MNRVRHGIVGTSGWTELMYFNNLVGRDDVEIAGLCGRSPGPLGQMAEKYRIGATYSDYRDMIANGGLDAIVIAAPDDQHVDMTLAAIDKGLHVLCEKPLANSAADARRMLEAAEQRGIRHMVLFTWRWQPHFQLLRDMLADGQFGVVYRAHFSFLSGFARNDLYQWRHDPLRANGILGDLGSHMIDLGRWYFGDVGSVSATVGNAISRAGIAGHEAGDSNDSAHLSLSFANGVLGVIDISAVSHSADMLCKHVVRIEAEKATLELEHVFFGERSGARINIMRADDDKIRAIDVPAGYFGASDPRNFLGIYKTEPVGVLGFIKAVREGHRPEPGFDVGVKVQEVVDAALVSGRERRVVDL